MESIKNYENLNKAPACLRKEQHTTLETCQGDLESVLVNAHMDDDHATNVVSNSLALRIT